MIRTPVLLSLVRSAQRNNRVMLLTAAMVMKSIMAAGQHMLHISSGSYVYNVVRLEVVVDIL